MRGLFAEHQHDRRRTRRKGSMKSVKMLIGGVCVLSMFLLCGCTKREATVITVTGDDSSVLQVLLIGDRDTYTTVRFDDGLVKYLDGTAGTNGMRLLAKRWIWQ